MTRRSSPCHCWPWRYPNIAVKVTGGPQDVTDAYPFKLPRHKAIYDAVGPGRIFWGTDITRLPSPGGNA